ncbi:MAG: hypothetical protein LBE04_04775 [Prevotellaceae bacterium]|nr:hypothetical protein [Prevotellaceae bacterium]
MRYKQYRNMGCGIIGSGAIESAHRTLIQKRNETIRTTMESKGGSKHAPIPDIILEYTVVESNRFSEIPCESGRLDQGGGTGAII